MTTLELDCGVTKDGVVVVSHDRVLNSNHTRDANGRFLASDGPAIVDLTRVSTHVAASPVEPLVAVAGGANTDVELYNVYTGALVRTFPAVAGTPAAIKFSGDGTRLFVHDTVNLNVRSLDALTGAELASFNATSISPDYRGLAIDTLRPNGDEILITPGGKVYDLATGAYYANDPYFSAVLALSLAHSPDQSLVIPQFGSVSRFRKTALRGGGRRCQGKGGHLPPVPGRQAASDRRRRYLGRQVQHDQRQRFQLLRRAERGGAERAG